jgi:DNA-directed RNA polymerase omega subunit
MNGAFEKFLIRSEDSVFMGILHQPPESKFVYVVVASRRARQLQTGARPLVDLPRARKHTRIAMEELNKGVLEYEVPDLPGEGEARETKKRKG